MSVQRFYIDKTSGTSADLLLATGFADLVRLVLEQLRRPYRGLQLEDEGSDYTVTVPNELTLNDLELLQPFTILLPLQSEKPEGKKSENKEPQPEEESQDSQTLEPKEESQDRQPTESSEKSESEEAEAKKKKAKRPKREQPVVLDGFDYTAQQERSKIYYSQLRNLPSNLRTPEARLNKHLHPELIDLEEPASELVYYQTINQMKIASSFNDLIRRWNELGLLQRNVLAILFGLFQQPGNDFKAAEASWKKLSKEHGLKGGASKFEVTELQIVNPTSGKGSNRSKSSTLTEGNPDNFWVLELLKFSGFMQAAAPYVIQGSKDRKTYVLQPRRIELSKLSEMMRTFRAVCWSSSAAKLDVMASLRFAQVFLSLRRKALEGMEADPDPLEEEELYSLAQSFEVVFYKDMGSAFATMNVSTINLPQWLPPIRTAETARKAEQLLKAHLTIIQQIRNNKGEEGAEEYTLLRHYRDFLSGRTLAPFWRFTTAYSSYLISQHEHEKDPKRWIHAFTTEDLENLVTMSTTKQPLTRLTSNPGFQRIAYAIRQSTVKAQYRRSQRKDRTYDVRYGLAQDLTREARYKEKFIKALADFLQQYNAETAREEEKCANRLGNRQLTLADRRLYGLRGSVSTSDLDEIVALVEEFSSETVCSLLVSYGYASDPRREPGNSQPGSSDQNGTGDDALPDAADTVPAGSDL